MKSSRWEEVEKFVETKMDGRESEDVIVTAPGFAAVIDGTSDETGAVFDGRSGGLFAAQSLSEAIAALGAETTAREFADHITDFLREAVSSVVGELDDSVRWPSASIVCFCFERDEIWRIGDCSFALDGAVFRGEKRVDDAAYGFRAAVNAARLAGGEPLDQVVAEDPGRQAGRALYDSQQLLSNRLGPWGFGCVNGRQVPDEYVEVHPVDDATEVVLASDGYPVLEPTLRESEDRLRTMMADDPAAVGDLWSMGKSLLPGANAMDDRAYLRLCRTS